MPSCLGVVRDLTNLCTHGMSRESPHFTGCFTPVMDRTAIRLRHGMSRAFENSIRWVLVQRRTSPSCVEMRGSKLVALINSTLENCSNVFHIPHALSAVLWTPHFARAQASSSTSRTPCAIRQIVSKKKHQSAVGAPTPTVRYQTTSRARVLGRVLPSQKVARPMSFATQIPGCTRPKPSPLANKRMDSSPTTSVVHVDRSSAPLVLVYTALKPRAIAAISQPAHTAVVNTPT